MEQNVLKQFRHAVRINEERLTKKMYREEEGGGYSGRETTTMQMIRWSERLVNEEGEGVCSR